MLSTLWRKTLGRSFQACSQRRLGKKSRARRFVPSIERLEDRLLLTLTADQIAQITPSDLTNGFRDGLSYLQDGLNSQVLSRDLPLVGTKLQQGAQFIAGLNSSNIITTLTNDTQNAGSALLALVQQGLNQVFGSGSGGLNLLEPLDGNANHTDINNLVGISYPADGTSVQFNMHLGQQSTYTVPFDLGLPGMPLNLDVSATGAVQVAMSWDFFFGFGFEIATNNHPGPYIDTNAADIGVGGTHVLQMNVTVTTPGLSLGGTLGFLQLTATDSTTSPSNVTGNFTVDLGGDNGSRLTIQHLTATSHPDFSTVVQAVQTANADVNLHLNATANLGLHDADGDHKLRVSELIQNIHVGANVFASEVNSNPAQAALDAASYIFDISGEVDAYLNLSVGIYDLSDNPISIPSFTVGGVTITNPYVYNLVTVTLYQFSTNSGNGRTDSVTLDPVPQFEPVGLEATFTAASSDPTDTVQWQVSTDGGTTFSDIPGATSGGVYAPRYTIPNVSATQQHNLYRGVFTNSAGSLTTTAAQLTISNVPLITAGGAFAYNGNAHAATVTVTAPLAGYQTPNGTTTVTYSGTAFSGHSYGPTGTPPTNAGSYSTMVHFTSTDGNYVSASASGNLLIAQADPTMTVTDLGGVFNGQSYPATASAAIGVDGHTAVSGSLTITYLALQRRFTDT